MHPARKLHERCSVIYTAHSKNTAYMKHHICLFVLKQECVPINPFMNFEYFLLDTVSRDVVRRANNSYVYVSDSLWTFGIISDGVFEEVRLAKDEGKPVRHFSVGKTLRSIHELEVGELIYEKDVEEIENLD